MYSAIHILWGQSGAARLAYRQCLCSGSRKRRFVVWDGGEYYGEDGICLSCGEQYGGDEWLERPFARGWRKANIAKAKRMLAAANAAEGIKRKSSPMTLNNQGQLTEWCP